MSDMSVSMSLPLDEDRFLRRECPNCERQFKWWHTPDEVNVADVGLDGRNIRHGY